MKDAYMKASGNNKYPANARQIMYAARPLVLQITNGKCWKNSSYFTQDLLPSFVDEYSELTEDWDVVYDARGHLTEPHMGTRTDLGTLDVRRYIGGWRDSISDSARVGSLVNPEVPTSGPANRYGNALFIEKEGFNELLKAAQIAERFDLAIMSTKGMSVTAARHLVEKLSVEGVNILVVRDFDKSGFSIVSTLYSDTRRYQFTVQPNVVDLGLRLSDVEAMGLESEYVEYKGKVDPRINLTQNGATEEECDFLVEGHEYHTGWVGKRVELNAMTSDQFISWLEQKLEAVGVRKVVPDDEGLAAAYRRAVRLAAVEKTVMQALDDLEDMVIETPDDLAGRLRERIEGTATSWDQALWDIVLEEERNRE